MDAKSAEKKAVSDKHLHETEGGVAGAISGAAMGAIAGPVGAVVGGVVGGVVGVVAGAILDDDSVDAAARERVLDEEIGVTSGAVGAPNLEHPLEKNVLFAEEEAKRLSQAPSIPTHPIPKPPIPR